MGAYKNFTVDLPKRIAELDQRFRHIASCADLDVSYMLMKLAASFLLPYERIEGTSGARKTDIADPQSIRKYLELDKRFRESAYCSVIGDWALIDVDGFDRGPVAWCGKEDQLDLLNVGVVGSVLGFQVSYELLTNECLMIDRKR